MVSQEGIDPPPSAPRISFSADFLDDSDFISISPDGHFHDQEAKAEEIPTLDLEKKPRNGEFEFLAAHMSPHKMMTADELFFEGKLLPFWQMQQSERLKRMTLEQKSGDSGEARAGGPDHEPDREEETGNKRNCCNSHNRDQDQEQNRASWFLDDDLSPRPPKCTVLWKELLRLKIKKRGSSALSPSSSSSSTSSSSGSLGNAASVDERKEARDRDRDRDRESNGNNRQRIRKGMERTRSKSIRIRPMVNVPICKHVKSAGGDGGGSLPPLFPLKKGRVVETERRGR